MNFRNVFCGLSIAVVLQVGVLAGSVNGLEMTFAKIPKMGILIA